ncbi:MAG: hypothetical protein V7K89_11290 [Nostoc sp.]
MMLSGSCSRPPSNASFSPLYILQFQHQYPVRAQVIGYHAELVVKSDE